MGWLDRLHDIGTASLGALEAPVGFVKDVGMALPELGTLNLPAFTGDVYKSFVSRAGQEVGSLVGPQGIGGTAIGALPEGARAGVGEVTGPVQSTMDDAYHSLIGKPLSAAFTAGSLASRPGGGGVGGLFRASTWAEAWNIAEHRSPGQSLALAFTTKDILDPNEVKKAQGTDWYHVGSGVTDAITRLTLDPTTLALGGATEYMKSLHAIDSAAAIEKMSANGSIGKFSDAIGGLVEQHGDGAAAAIRNEYFSKHPLGAQISDILANVDKLPPGYAQGATGDALRERVIRVLAGAVDEQSLIRDARPDLAGQIDRLAQRRDMLKSMSNAGFDLANQPDDISNIERELGSLYDQQGMLDRLQQNTATLQSMPKATSAVSLRGRFSTGDFYQNSVFAKPLRAVFAMEPHPWIHLDDPTSDVSVWRMLQKSDLPLDTQLQWRSRYMAAQDPTSRLAISAAAENAAVGSIAEKAGMAPDELHRVLSDAADGRSLAKRALDSRAYDGEGRSVITFDGEDGVAHKIHMLDAPLYETQLPNLAPMVDLDKVRDAISPITKFKARHPGISLLSDGGSQLLDQFSSVWKPSVLLRVGFPVRFVTDETLRSMAKIGVLSTLKNMSGGVRDYAADKLAKVGIDMSRDIENVNLAGHQFEGAFGTPGDGHDIYKNLITARESFGTLVSADEGKVLDQLIQSGPWRHVEPTEPAYAASWEHAVNNQIGKSALGSKLLEDMQSPTATQLENGVVPKTRDEIVANTVDWLRKSPDGQALAKQLPFRRNLDQWVGAAHDQIDAYLPTDELKAAAWADRATHDMLVDHMPNASDRPFVHGGVLDQMMGTHPIGQMWRKFVDAGMQNLVGKPSNILMRQPFFEHMYTSELARQASLLTGYEEPGLMERMGNFLRGGTSDAAGPAVQLTADDMRQMEFRARRYALSQTKDLFHNFAEEPSMAKTLGFLSPFYTAWSQILGRWAGLAVDNPAFVNRMRLAWRAPERMGIVTDGAGNVVDENGKIITPIPNSQYTAGGDAADGQRNVTLHLPDWAHDIPGLKHVGDFEFGKDSLNMILHGLPPVGPIVQVGANEIAKARPDLESSLGWALPYGVSQNSLDILKPTIVKRLQTQSEGDANRSYAYSAMRIYTDKMIDYNLGKRASRPTWAEASNDANAFWKMRTIASFSLPVTPQFTSPYQMYIDAYRARKDLDAKLSPAQRQDPSYKTPDEWFLDTYGQEFFPVVASMSKSIDGIAPTVEGQRVHEQFADLISKYPDLGGLIQGFDGAGAFSSAVYNGQFSQRVGPETAGKERQVMPFDQFRNEASTRLGWIQFGRVMDQLDALRIQRGLPSLSVSGAKDLAAAKKFTIQYLANDPKYAGWFEDYASTDASKWDQRIAGMTAIVADKRLAERPEFQGLAQYLKARAQITTTLSALGSGHANLSGQANAAIQGAWDVYVNDLVDHNPAFAALYHRWLQNDPVSVTPITLAAQAGTLAY